MYAEKMSTLMVILFFVAITVGMAMPNLLAYCIIGFIVCYLADETFKKRRE